MKHPFVSVVIPTLNEENFTKIACLLAAQQIKDFEVIIVDGSSKDRTVEQAKRYGAKFLAARFGE